MFLLPIEHRVINNIESKKHNIKKQSQTQYDHLSSATVPVIVAVSHST